MDMRLRKRQATGQLFCSFWGARAAVRAGYSAHKAHAIAYENLTKLNIRTAIEERMKERAERVGIKADDVLRELAYIAFADIGEIFDFSGEAIRLKPAKEIPPEARRAVASLKVKVEGGGSSDQGQAAKVLEFRLLNKIEALRDLGRHLGMWTDKMEHTFTGGVPVTLAEAEAGRQKVEEYRRQRAARVTAGKSR
jgi:phage terminase small subunit